MPRPTFSIAWARPIGDCRAPRGCLRSMPWAMIRHPSAAMSVVTSATSRRVRLGLFERRLIRVRRHLGGVDPFHLFGVGDELAFDGGDLVGGRSRRASCRHALDGAEVTDRCA